MRKFKCTVLLTCLFKLTIAQSFFIEVGPQFFSQSCFSGYQENKFWVQHSGWGDKYDYQSGAGLALKAGVEFFINKRWSLSPQFAYQFSQVNYKVLNELPGFQPETEVGDVQVTVNSVIISSFIQAIVSNPKNYKSKSALGVEPFLTVNLNTKSVFDFENSLYNELEKESEAYNFSPKHLNTFQIGINSSFTQFWRYSGKSYKSKYVYLRARPGLVFNSIFEPSSSGGPFFEENEYSKPPYFSINIALGITL